MRYSERSQETLFTFFGSRNESGFPRSARIVDRVGRRPVGSYAPSAITRFFFIHGIIERNCAPTVSIGCFLPASTS